MSDVQFDEASYTGGTYNQYEKPSGNGFQNFLIRMGVVKDKKQADMVLLGIAGLFFITSLFLFARLFWGQRLPVAPPGGFPIAGSDINQDSFTNTENQ